MATGEDKADWATVHIDFDEPLRNFLFEVTCGLLKSADASIDNFAVERDVCKGLSVPPLNHNPKRLNFVLFSSLVVNPTGPDGGRHGNNAEMAGLPWSCTFGPTLEQMTLCECIQDTTDNGDWIVIYGPTPTNNTGPPMRFAPDYGT